MMPSINFRTYADLCETYPFEEERLSPAACSLVLREPVGVAVAIPPFNGPLTLGTQKAAPALAAGCTVILKAPVQNGLACYVFAEAVEEAGLPPGVVNVLVADAAESERLVTHPGVDKVSFTGSTPVGKRIAELCGRDIRRVTLELGGKSAAIMLDDVDVEKAVPGIVACSVGDAPGRDLHGPVADPRAPCALRRDRRRVGGADRRAAGRRPRRPRHGDRSDDHARAPRARRGLHPHRRRGGRHREGRRRAAGPPGPRLVRRADAASPTVTNDMRVAREEIFGPVAVVIPHDGVDDAIAIANDSPFGLSGTVWTEDEDAALAVARRVRTGTIALNTYTVDPDTPFGGYKESGIGREMGREGLDGYVELKSVAVSGPSLG